MKLYIYDHCPYCVRVVMAKGLKDINCEVINLLNDDEATPINMVGSKQAPILQKPDGTFIPESLDIIEFFDNFQGKKIFAKFSGCEELEEWRQKHRVLLYELLMPRWPQINTPEFKTQGAKDYFTKKKQAMIGDFSTHLTNTPKLIKELEKALQELIPLLKTNYTFNKTLSYDDIDIFSRLRGLACIQGVKIPKKILNYMKYYSEKAQVKLHFDLAI